MRARSAIGAVGAAALVTTGLSPAIAAANSRHHSDEVRVLVCKIVKSDHRWDHGGHNWQGNDNNNNDNNNYDHNNYRSHHHDQTFGMKVWTDSEKGWTRLGNRDCASFKLDFARNKVRVKEYVDSDRWDTYFRAYGDVLKSKQIDSTFRVKFDDSERYPSVKIFVVNKRAHHSHYPNYNNDSHHHNNDYSHYNH